MAVAPFKWDSTIQWDGPGAIDGVVEELAGDRLDRARYAEFLTNYLAAEGKQRNYVLNLNAEWGAGKTWFIKRWYMELKAHYPTVYIDAWQQDFSDDPLLTVIASIIEQLRDATGNKLAVPDGIKSKLLGLLKVGGKLVLKSAIKKAGLEDGDFSVEGEDADKLVDTLCSNHKERYESIQYLKQEIRQWVEAAVSANLDQLDGQGRLDYPAFILIDELDRCRPSYAVEMLETIKHIFDIKGVVFVLATDTEQLQHAIKVVYGEGFDAQNYLGRFFIRRFTLKNISRHEFITCMLTWDKSLSLASSIWPILTKEHVLISVISSISDYLSLSLRQTEQLVDRIVAVIKGCLKESECIGSINILFLTYLFALYERDYELYLQVSSCRIARSGGTDSIDVQLGKRTDILITLEIMPSKLLNTLVNGKWVDGVYDMSLVSLLHSSYEMIVISNQYKAYSLGKDHTLARAINSEVGSKELNPFEAALLARPELSLLENRIEVYKNIVELAIHLD
ncbi:TPA: AAA family ATPase [Aeromonas sobria]|nr:AAA family ATPase [Aeromonas sobria]